LNTILTGFPKRRTEQGRRFRRAKDGD